MRKANLKSRLNKRRASGTTLIELIAAGAILGVLLIVCMQMLTRSAAQQRTVANRQAALQAAANVMERVAALPWSQLTPDGAQGVARTVAEQGMLPGAKVEVAVDEPSSPLPGRRIRVIVTWTEREDETQRKQQLVAWRYDQRPVTSPDGAPAAPSAGPEAKP